jgi:hypothetical protein
LRASLCTTDTIVIASLTKDYGIEFPILEKKSNKLEKEENAGNEA